jgi:hypothetical protein
MIYIIIAIIFILLLIINIIYNLMKNKKINTKTLKTNNFFQRPITNFNEQYLKNNILIDNIDNSIFKQTTNYDKLFQPKSLYSLIKKK